MSCQTTKLSMRAPRVSVLWVVEVRGRERCLHRARMSWSDICSALLLQSVIHSFIQVINQMCTGGIVCSSYCSKCQGYGRKQAPHVLGLVNIGRAKWGQGSRIIRGDSLCYLGSFRERLTLQYPPSPPLCKLLWRQTSGRVRRTSWTPLCYVRVPLLRCDARAFKYRAPVLFLLLVGLTKLVTKFHSFKWPHAVSPEIGDQGERRGQVGLTAASLSSKGHLYASTYTSEQGLRARADTVKTPPSWQGLDKVMNCSQKPLQGCSRLICPRA